MNQIATQDPRDEPTNPFSNQAVVVKPQGAMAEAESQKGIAEIQAALVIGKRNPRDQAQAMDNILNACTRRSLAEQALYSYSRGGTEITGPSIRLAETLAQNWGNIRFGIHEIEQRPGMSIVKAFAWDVQTNTMQEKIFQVAHKRHTKKGAYALDDPRDVYELIANNGARRLRACILGVIPGDVVEAAVSQCETTLATSETITPDSIKKMADAFKAFGVTTDMIEKRIQRRMDTITSPQMVQLRKIYTSIKDGMSGPGEWFEIPEGQATTAATATETVREKLKAKTPQDANKEIDGTQAAPKDVEMVDVLDSAGDVYSMPRSDYDNIFPADRPQLAGAKK